MASGQNEKVKIVFDVTSSDTKVHESAIRQIRLMLEAYQESEFEMVVYSGALPMTVKSQSTLETEIEGLTKSANVSLKVCAMALKKYDLKVQDLINGVCTIPDGIIELVDKQRQG